MDGLGLFAILIGRANQTPIEQFLINVDMHAIRAPPMAACRYDCRKESYMLCINYHMISLAVNTPGPIRYLA
jgi:hypothetical protein